MSDGLAGNAQASKAAMADETSTDPRSLQATVEDYTSDSGEDATVLGDFSKDPSKPSNVSWKSPEVTKSKAQRSEAATRSSQTTTAVPTASGVTSRNTAKEVNTASRRPPIESGYRASKRLITISHGSSDDSNGTEDERESDEEAGEEWDIIEDEIEPGDSASRPRQRLHAPRPAPRASTKTPTQKGGAPRKPATSGRIRRRDHEPSPQRSRPPSYHTDLSSQYAPGRPSNWSYPPGYAPTPPMINPFSPPVASPPNGGYAPSGYAPSMLSGTTMVPWGYWPAPMQRPPTPPPRKSTPAPPEPSPASLPPPPPPPMMMPPPPPPPVTEPEPTTVTDPIELVETFLAALKESKQKDLLDAGRILTWVNLKLG